MKRQINGVEVNSSKNLFDDVLKICQEYAARSSHSDFSFFFSFLASVQVPISILGISI